MANLVEDTVVPKEGSSKRDYLALLEHAAKESKKSKDVLEQSTLKNALATMHDAVMLQDDPDVLMLDVIKTGRLSDEPSRFFLPAQRTAQSHIRLLNRFDIL